MLYKEIRALARGVVVFWIALFVLGIISVAATYGANSHFEPTYGLIDGYRAMGWVTAVLAVVFGTSLPSECGDHARYALVRPVSRTAYALGVFACGAVALGVAYLFSGLAAYLPVAIVTGFRYIGAPAISPMVPLYVGYIHALAWYAFVAGLGTLARHAWAAAAAAVIGAVVAYVLGQSATPFGAAVRALDMVNPMTYYVAAIGATESPGKHYQALVHLPVSTDALVLLGIAIVWAAAGTIRWHRLQVS